MLPKITDPLAWQQAEILMQPAFIRVIDHIGKQLEASKWRGTYKDVMVWPEGTTEEVKGTVTQLVHYLDTASPDQVTEIEQRLIHLPTPQPEYHLCLHHQGVPEVEVNLWELCYQICFCSYDPSGTTHSNDIKIDTSLIDETGDIDWQQLDEKAGELVAQLFANLPDV
ncbi:hypothetical protein IQ230_07090 [Gloeocapsopsis crepidinum LEGE 06123]|uniref:Uncharacterized protein n=1 Tax=Gloeocapsopsis crepidinum LEGE 06123 TaxID=588587 RepID=A0ABR9UPZ9_9CHRO|nr:hypothetical protein [Gloeocapsopsis crepidinum]MBE9190130.1 hypothetical protein [Gloeocapsopsis crepidinum LEGE 06123]